MILSLKRRTCLVGLGSTLALAAATCIPAIPPLLAAAVSFVGQVETWLGLARQVLSLFTPLLPADVAARTAQRFDEAIQATQRALAVLRDVSDAVKAGNGSPEDVQRRINDVVDAVDQVAALIEEAKMAAPMGARIGAPPPRIYAEWQVRHVDLEEYRRP